MNIMVRDTLVPSLTAEDLRKAHADAKRLGCNVTTVVEENYGIDSSLSMVAIARLFHYQVLDLSLIHI